MTVCHCMGPSQDQSHLVLSEGEGGGRRARTELPAAQELIALEPPLKELILTSPNCVSTGWKERKGWDRQFFWQKPEVIAHGGQEPWWSTQQRSGNCCCGH